MKTNMTVIVAIFAIAITTTDANASIFGRSKRPARNTPQSALTPTNSPASPAQMACSITGIVPTGPGQTGQSSRSSATTVSVTYITGTNGVGMKGGFPVLIKNACGGELWARFKRLDGPGSVRLPVSASDSTTVLLLEGSYSVSWGKPNMGLPVGQTTMVIDPNNLGLVVGEGEFVADLRLTPE